MKAYKLLTQNLTSRGGMTWEIGGTNTAAGPGTAMCSPDLLHCYAHPALAVLFNPIHAGIKNPRLFEITTSEILANDGLKMGCKSQTLVKELELPVFTPEQRVEFGIRCALEVCSDAAFRKWAERWLSGEYRGEAAAHAATCPASDTWASYTAHAAAYANAASNSKIDFVKIAESVK